jgi:4-amino-4-deoxy-L-arabinose transferase-like glycosyltransferase
MLFGDIHNKEGRIYMNSLNIAQIVFATVGLTLIIYGIIYSKELHIKLGTSDSWLGFGGCILAVLPWYVAKMIYILSGIFSLMLFITSFSEISHPS